MRWWFYNGELIAGGSFTTTFNGPTSNLARWTGSAWQTFAGGVNLDIYALTVVNNDLIAGGIFTSAGGVPVNHIARWNGSTWQSLGTGVDSAVLTITPHQGDLVVGGDFMSAGGIPASRIARWNGTAWLPIGVGMNHNVNATLDYGGQVIAGGVFTMGGGFQSANHVAAQADLTFTESPQDQIVVAGQPVTFSVVASGTPAPSYQWRKSGMPLRNGGAISDTTTTALTINAVIPEDFGAYDVLVSNSCGSVVSAAAALAVTSSCPADTNGSGAVDVDDLIAIILGWGACP